MESKLKTEAEKEAAQDQMKALEQKAVDVQSEMQRLEDLDAIRTMNKRPVLLLLLWLLLLLLFS
ncbi:unnamed protein product [Polarella glacialis]|uniref:Coiled-coil domain-containing protein 167 n=1 Tax=Polarella glacialis TaxID=89957 RepID=A0A813EQQ9_POLGL|nr:unnamed protein product [Polarella glacialis]CAE8692557.1 unnamed protein product [Polarella glacialis]